MKHPETAITDGNEAVARVAYRLSETVAIYPITPSSPMAEWCDEWAAQGKPNLWGVIPTIAEMQSEGGAAGAVHGALLTGSLATTFTASQGLLLMIPNMYKIAGELMPFVMHVTARTLASHALSIFGDHQDVMACRQTGFALLASNSVQETQDMATIAHLATLESRIPFLHFFDGFRTSHEVNSYVQITNAELEALVDEELIRAHRQRALTPDRPMLRGTAQNPDVFFQARESCNRYYDACPDIVQETMRRFKQVTGRAYELFEYVGHKEPESVIIAMGSGVETIEETVHWLNATGAKVGVLKIRLFRPWSLKHFVAALPRSVRSIAVLDRTKEPGTLGDPLYLEVRAAIDEARQDGLLPDSFAPKIIGGRYGLSSKEFTPSMVRAVYNELANPKAKTHFTVGINDDVTRLSIPWDASFDIERADIKRAVFFGLGSDGTVGANKNSIKIIGDETDFYAQAYFVYDSKKSGSVTISHLRFGPDPIKAPYLIYNAQFVACHQFTLLEKHDVLDCAMPGGVFLLNSIYPADRVWNHIPREVQAQIIEKKLRFYVIDAYEVAKQTGMGGRINTIMQTCFFAISGVLPRDEAIAAIKKAIEKTYGRKGESVVKKNWEAVDGTLANLYEVAVPALAESEYVRPPVVMGDAPDFVQRITAMMMANKGESLPVSAFPVDGTFPTDTARWEKRNIAIEIPVWDASICIQCNKCVLVCPHAAIRAKFYPENLVATAPETFKSTPFKAREFPGTRFTIQVAPEDCTGCELCVAVCPAKDKKQPNHKAINMAPQEPLRIPERANYDFFLKLPDPDRLSLEDNVKGTQFRQPLFEYSGACAGCGETPYIKLLTQLFGDRVVIANATGCSSIYGGNLPTTPYAKNPDGRGPAWANSLFEDNAEFGFGMRMSLDNLRDNAIHLLQGFASELGDDLVKAIVTANQGTESGVHDQRARVALVREKLAGNTSLKARKLRELADYLVKKSVWIIGGDGWSYDIGFGGLDHVLASGRDVNVLVLDTGVYSNTGGQQSKATPMGALAKFAAAGKGLPKKDLGMLMSLYGHIYVAQVAMGAKDSQTVQALIEADSYEGPSLVIAYSHCIAHGYNMNFGLEQQKLAVNTGFWPLYRFDPRRGSAEESPMKLDSAAPKAPLNTFTDNEARFKMLAHSDPERAKLLATASQEYVKKHYALFEQMATKPVTSVPATTSNTASTPA
ncbi:MAG: pyruvate:ferredoxin (flavodoxin) oxidoreductase [Verrucomicrobiota bacterium]|nr:pyruvate:ferredoxin (flavodoxin) oxidoreductase [Verrucomicrobiota bacterium]